MKTESILDTLTQQLGSGTIARISEQLGTDPGATSNAISMALPILLGGLARNASSADGANDLDSALGEHDGAVLDDMSGFVNAIGGSGAGILGHILGARRTPVEQGVGRATGLNARQVSQLLIMIAPLVMGALGRMKKQKALTTKELPGVLNQERSEIEKRAPEAGGLARIFDQNQDGQIADDIARIGTSVFGRILGGSA